MKAIKRLKKPSLLNRCCKHITYSIIMALVSLFVYALFTGCAGKEYIEIVKTVEIKTPVECNLSAPVLAPYRDGQTAQNEINIYIYAEDLENTLKACKGEK